MLRFTLLLIAALMVTGCGIRLPSMPTSFLADEETGRDRAARTDEKRTASASSLGSFWSTLTSPFGKGEGKTDKAALTASNFQPEKAQKLINDYRARKGLPPLALNTKLQMAAQMHSEDLAKNDRISHYGSDGSDVEFRVRKAGYSFNVVAENVGTGQQTVEEVIKGWQTSPTHNENLLIPDAKHMGIALVYKPDTEFRTFWTLVVGAGQ